METIHLDQQCMAVVSWKSLELGQSIGTDSLVLNGTDPEGGTEPNRVPKTVSLRFALCFMNLKCKKGLFSFSLDSTVNLTRSTQAYWLQITLSSYPERQTDG